MPIIEDKKSLKNPAQAAHSIILENRNHLSVSGVSDVDSFDDGGVVLYTTQGTLNIRGSGMHINKLNVDNGEVTIDGEIWSMDYSDSDGKKGGFFSRFLR